MGVQLTGPYVQALPLGVLPHWTGLQSGGATSWTLQSLLIKRGHSLFLLAEWCHWLDSTTGQGYGLGLTIAPGHMGFHAVLPYQKVLLAGLHV